MHVNNGRVRALCISPYERLALMIIGIGFLRSLWQNEQTTDRPVRRLPQFSAKNASPRYPKVANVRRSHFPSGSPRVPGAEAPAGTADPGDIYGDVLNP